MFNVISYYISVVSSLQVYNSLNHEHLTLFLFLGIKLTSNNWKSISRYNKLNKQCINSNVFIWNHDEISLRKLARLVKLCTSFS